MNTKIKILFWLLLILPYLITRLVNLKIIPIFTDEAIYSYWAQVALHDPANRFISLEDGKQPLFIWLSAIAQKFITDPLIAGRIVSVFAGLGSLIGIYFLAKEIFDRQDEKTKEKIALFASFLYLIMPFTLLYDRMALFDSLLTMFGIYSTLFLIRLAKNPDTENSILSGVAIGLATITKSSGFFFLYLLPFSLLFFDFKIARVKFRFLKWFGYVVITFVITEIVYNSLRLSPLFYIIGRKNLSFIRTASEVIIDPFLHFSSNASTLGIWMAEYIGWPLLATFVLTMVFGFAKRRLELIFLSIYVLVPFATEVFFNKIIYPRFILFYLPFIIVLISYAAISMAAAFSKYQKFIWVVFFVFLTTPLASSFYLITEPTKAKIADSDAGQYLNAWPAGYGVSEIVEIIKRESKDQQVYIGTEGTFGLLPYALRIYFFASSNVKIEGFWPVDQNNLPTQVVDASQKYKAYFVFNENQKQITDPRLQFVAKYQKGKGASYMRLYEVTPQ